MTRSRESSGRNREIWPELPYQGWKNTYETLHLWTQIAGKVCLKLNPFINHWWHVALYVSARGLRTSMIPFGNRAFEIEFNFIDHLLSVTTADGRYVKMALKPVSVSEFYHEFTALLKSLELDVLIDLHPKEVPISIPFDQDHQHASYDAEYARRHWEILVQCDRIFRHFRGRFTGKCSPVHFFWGSFDLAVTRFSGRPAPARPVDDRIVRIAYSHEVSSCGFWPGSGSILEPAFYCYFAPEPEGFSQSKILPGSAFYNPLTKGFILPYEEIRRSKDPDRTLLEFCESTYEAGATLGKWNREELEIGFPLNRVA